MLAAAKFLSVTWLGRKLRDEFDVQLLTEIDHHGIDLAHSPCKVVEQGIPIIITRRLDPSSHKGTRLQHDDIVDTRFLELVGGKQASSTAANANHFMMSWRHDALCQESKHNLHGLLARL